MPPDYSESWKRLAASSNVPICTGENLARAHGFKDFILNQGCDILHPDLRNTGGFLETKRIADMAEVFGLPMATHNTGSIVATLAQRAVGGIDPRLHRMRNDHGTGRLDGRVGAARRPDLPRRNNRCIDQAGAWDRVESGCGPRPPGDGRTVVGLMFRRRAGF